MRRSQLYVPGNNEKMIRKASELDADSVILDLEDSVPPQEKSKARRKVRELADSLDWGSKELCVRINAPSSPEGKRDMVDFGRAERVDAVVTPKAEVDLSFVAKATGKEIIPLIETPKGLLRIEEVIRSENVTAVSYGVADFAAAVGGDVKAYENNQYLKTKVVTTASAYGIDALDRVFFALKDLKGFEADAREARALGYAGKQVIHPEQVKLANIVFSPTREDLEWSRKVARSYQDSVRIGTGAIRIDDRLLDAVHYRIAKRTLEKAGEPLDKGSHRRGGSGR